MHVAVPAGLADVDSHRLLRSLASLHRCKNELRFELAEVCLDDGIAVGRESLDLDLELDQLELRRELQDVEVRVHTEQKSLLCNKPEGDTMDGKLTLMLHCCRHLGP